MRDGTDRTLGQRVLGAFLKDAPEQPEGATKPATVTELEGQTARADDKERLIGLLAAPVAAVIGLAVSASLIANDPKRLLATGQVNNLYVNPTLYAELGAVTVMLAVVMLAMAWYRKRLYLGITMALYGLSIFNLHFWGFGVPYIMVGSWLLVRAYRYQSKLKLARTDAAARLGPARANKRYTPPSS